MLLTGQCLLLPNQERTTGLYVFSLCSGTAWKACERAMSAKD